MIRQEQITINGSQFIRTYSDEKFYIERDGEQYREAIDPADSSREYTETNVEIEREGL